MSESIINKNLKTFQIVTVIFPVESIGRSMVRLLRKNVPYHVRKRQHDGLEISVSSASTVRSHAVDIWAAFQRREVGLLKPSTLGGVTHVSITSAVFEGISGDGGGGGLSRSGARPDRAAAGDRSREPLGGLPRPVVGAGLP